MKRLLFLAISLTIFLHSFANPVDPTRARLVAANYLRSLGGEASVMADKGLVLRPAIDSLPDIYYFATPSGKGFVLVASDDNAYPVLGYSTSAAFSAAELPRHIFEWLRNYQSQISDLRHDDAVIDIAPCRLWQQLAESPLTTLPLSTSVSPLLSTTWSQSEPYNDQCPLDGSYRSVVGCVATAMSQVMKYWNWPTTGEGSYSYVYHGDTLSANFGATTYDWNNMPDYFEVPYNSTQVNAVAQLCYHAGIAVKMGYTYNASSANSISYGRGSISAETALINYFRYKSTLTGTYRGGFSDDDWCALLRNELDNARPIIYGGYGGGGHCFVFDGYNALSLFHVNWGWGGYCDGYYMVGALNPASGGTGASATSTYNLANQAIIGIEPARSTAASTTTVTLHTNDASLGTVTGGGTFANGSGITLRATATAGSRFSHWSDSTGYNPRQFRCKGTNLDVTAVFVPIQGDTIGYCSGAYTGSYFGSSQGLEFGIRIPANLLTPGTKLYQVQTVLRGVGTYTLKVYTGGTSAPGTLVRSQAIRNIVVQDWMNIGLESPLDITGTDDLWLMIEATGDPYAACLAPWSGNTYGQYYRYLSNSNYNNYNTNGSFLVRGVFTIDPPESYCQYALDTLFGSASSTLQTTYIPVSTAFPYNVAQFIVTSEQINASSIASFSIYYDYSAYNVAKHIFNIYCQPTTLSEFASNADFQSLDTARATLVWSGAWTMAPGWNTFVLPTPYRYDGQSNLLFIFEDNSGRRLAGPRPFRAYNAGSYRGISAYGFNGIEASSPLNTADSVRRTTLLPIMKINGCQLPVVHVHDSVCIKYQLQLNSDPSQGICAGAGEYPEGSQVEILAIPASDRIFGCWSDGNTQNPRTITITRDTTLTAYFE